jgi:hypothetical protein
MNFDYLHNRKIRSFGTGCHKTKKMLANFGTKHMTLKKGAAVSKGHDNLMSMTWKDY